MRYLHLFIAWQTVTGVVHAEHDSPAQVARRAPAPRVSCRLEEQSSGIEEDSSETSAQISTLKRAVLEVGQFAESQHGANPELLNWETAFVAYRKAASEQADKQARMQLIHDGERMLAFLEKSRKVAIGIPTFPSPSLQWLDTHITVVRSGLQSDPPRLHLLTPESLNEHIDLLGYLRPFQAAVNEEVKTLPNLPALRRHLEDYETLWQTRVKELSRQLEVLAPGNQDERSRLLDLRYEAEQNLHWAARVKTGFDSRDESWTPSVNLGPKSDRDTVFEEMLQRELSEHPSIKERCQDVRDLEIAKDELERYLTRRHREFNRRSDAQVKTESPVDSVLKNMFGRAPTKMDPAVTFAVELAKNKEGVLEIASVQAYRGKPCEGAPGLSVKTFVVEDSEPYNAVAREKKRREAAIHSTQRVLCDERQVVKSGGVRCKSDR